MLHTSQLSVLTFDNEAHSQRISKCSFYFPKLTAWMKTSKSKNTSRNLFTIIVICLTRALPGDVDFRPLRFVIDTEKKHAAKL